MTDFLNPELLPDDFRDTFETEGMVRIPGILTGSAAESLYQCLVRDVPWRLAFVDPDRDGKDAFRALPPEEFAALNTNEKAALSDKIRRQSVAGYQYLYNSYDLLKAMRAGETEGSFLGELLNFLGSENLFEFLHQVTGIEDFNRIDGHATRYMPGHYLKEHVDASPYEKRHVAYVLSMTPAWQVDWGGLLHFFDSDTQQVSRTLVPDFNSLTLFKVPVAHCVSTVSNFATGPRLSVTGWLTEYDE